MIGRTVLIVAAHPDDEILGCGGAMARHAAAGDTVHVVIVAEGATSRDDVRDVAARAVDLADLKSCATAAAAELGAQPPILLGLPDNRLDSLPLIDVIKPIEEIGRRLRPHVVYTHCAEDLNVDHRIVHQAVLTAFRPQPGESVIALYAFEVPSSTEWRFAGGASAFTPQRFVAIDAARKRAALGHYPSEMRPWPHARSLEAVEALARWRGASVGLPAAEAFMVVRETIA
jgi:N-acetylglucosamine malate deacetylase 1